MSKWLVTQETKHLEIGYRLPSGRFIGTSVTAHVRAYLCSQQIHIGFWTFDVFCHVSTLASISSTGGRFAIGDKKTIGDARKAAEKHARDAIDGKPAPGQLKEIEWGLCAACERADKKRLK